MEDNNTSSSESSQPSSPEQTTQELIKSLPNLVPQLQNLPASTPNVTDSKQQTKNSVEKGQAEPVSPVKLKFEAD